MMEINQFKQRLHENRVPVGHMLFEFTTRGMAQILEAAGLDFVVIDMEHSSFNMSQTADLIAGFRATTVTPFVRVPQVQYHHIARVMDAGAFGVVAPNVKNAGEARELVNASKYSPIGNRGFFHGGANSNYRSTGPENFSQYIHNTNNNTSAICLIESVEGIENIDEIASTPGIDALWAGYADLSLSMGIPGQFEDEQFLKSLESIAKTARRHGLAAIIQPSNAAQLKHWVNLGYNAISYGDDISVYRRALATVVTQAREAVGCNQIDG